MTEIFLLIHFQSLGTDLDRFSAKPIVLTFLFKYVNVTIQPTKTCQLILISMKTLNTIKNLHLYSVKEFFAKF